MSVLPSSPTSPTPISPAMPFSDSSSMTYVEKTEHTGRDTPKVERQRDRKVILLLASSEYGSSNVVLAVVSELVLLNLYDIHVASFKPLHHRIKQLNKSVPIHGSPVIFHLVAGTSAFESLCTKNEYIGPYTPGIRGAKAMHKITMPALLNTWEGPEYVAGYKSCLKIICSINPDIVVVEPSMSQGLEACEKLSYKCVILSANTFHDLSHQQQPLSTRAFKFPAPSSAFTYPLPLSRIPANLYLNLHAQWTFNHSPKIAALNKYRLKNDLPPLSATQAIYNTRHHYLVPSIPETDYPIHIPPNVTSCGPITLPSASVAKLDPELFTWLKRGPIVLVNLGSQIVVDDVMASEIAFGLKILLHRIPGLQVLWKLKTKNGRGVDLTNGFKGVSIKGDATSALSKEIVDGRVRIVEWLKVGPLAVMKTGNVMASIHHGGTNSFHEALGAGIPQVVLPNCMTLSPASGMAPSVDTAGRVEFLGVGVHGSRGAAPGVEAGEMFRAIMRVLGESESAVEIRQKARDLGARCVARGGRKRAAEVISELVEGRKRERSWFLDQ